MDFGQAFADPSMVKNVSDRQPRSSLLLLKYFSVSTNDPDLKKRIEERPEDMLTSTIPRCSIHWEIEGEK
jgi:hypothetical protein